MTHRMLLSVGWGTQGFGLRFSGFETCVLPTPSTPPTSNQNLYFSVTNSVAHNFCYFFESSHIPQAVLTKFQNITSIPKFRKAAKLLITTKTAAACPLSADDIKESHDIFTYGNSETPRESQLSQLASRSITHPAGQGYFSRLSFS